MYLGARGRPVPLQNDVLARNDAARTTVDWREFAGMVAINGPMEPTRTTGSLAGREKRLIADATGAGLPY